MIALVIVSFMSSESVKSVGIQDNLKLEYTRVKMMYEQLGEGLLPYYAWLATLLIILMISEANLLGIIFWVTLIVVIEVYEAKFRKRFFTLKEVSNPRLWEWYMVICIGCSALTISIGMMLMIGLNEQELMYTSFVLIAITALVSGALLVTSVRAQYVWVLGLLLPIVIKTGASGDVAYWIFGSAILFGGMPTAILIGGKLHRDFVETLRLRFENSELLAIAQAEKNNAEEERRRAEKASKDKSRFLAATSHDLRQPLHALDLFLGGLRNRLRVEKNRELLLQAQASSSALRELLNALLDISRFDAGEVHAHIEDVSLMSIFRECYAELLPTAETKGLDLRLHACPDYCIKTDAVLLTRMLRNLISNAVRYTSSGGVLIGARKRGSYIEIGVWDTGKGIGIAQQAHIFDEYYQIDNPERDREKGLGLGLAIVHRLSQLLEHPVGLQSNLGGGSYFHISVPFCENANVDLAMPEEEVYEHGLEGLFVLVIDDHQPILDGMRNLLRDWDCEVLLAQSKADMFDDLKAYDYPTPNVLLVDYRLRGNETGVEAIHAIRAYFNTEIPAILMTGDLALEVEAVALETNALFVSKPVSAKQLKKLLHQYI